MRIKLDITKLVTIQEEYRRSAGEMEEAIAIVKDIVHATDEEAWSGVDAEEARGAGR